ncbi:very short patch repair endonuclease [Olsenella sp. An290]|nr:very short patch repair endonuclease [Olsenella sp. An290]
MQANRSKDTKPELRVRAALRAAGLTGYRLHWRKAPGRPDVCFPGRRVAIFVHGCFWHRCPHCSPSRPKTHSEFWQAKFARNRARDARDSALLVEAGWTVVVIWECALKRGRAEATMAEVVSLVRRAGEERLPARVVEAGGPGAWRLRARRRRLRLRRRRG